jgi:uncharacterized protein YlxP (DUF503 family)
MNEKGCVSWLVVELELPGCKSLKEKRGKLQPLLLRLRREFNVSAAEIGMLDLRDTSRVAFSIVSNDGQYNQQVLNHLVIFIEDHFPEMEILQYRIEDR